MIANKEAVYLKFISYCLNDDKVCNVDIDNWSDLLDFAKKQTIVGVYWQEIQRLGNTANKPSEDKVMDWMGEYTKIVRQNAKTNDAVGKLAKLMHDNCIRFFCLQRSGGSFLLPLS